MISLQLNSITEHLLCDVPNIKIYVYILKAVFLSLWRSEFRRDKHVVTIAWCKNYLTGGGISVDTDDTHW